MRIRLFTLSLLLLAFNAHSQNAISLKASVRESHLRGGLIGGKYHVTKMPQFSIGYDKQLSQRFGLSIYASYGRRQYSTHPPSYYELSPEDDVLNLGYAEIDSERWRMSSGNIYIYHSMRSYEMFLGAAFYASKKFIIRFGPTIEHNSPIHNNDPYSTSPSYYYPLTYKKTTIGAQLQLCLRLPIGKYFFIDGNLSAARTFGDLREDEWKHLQYRYVIGSPNKYFTMPSEKLHVNFLAYGIGFGVQW